jgi:hypothetical protein
MNNNLTFRKTFGSQQTACQAIGHKRLSEFTVQVTSGKYFFIGFALGLDGHPVGMYFTTSSNYNVGTSTRIVIRDRITAKREGLSITFLVNGLTIGSADSKSTEEMYPAVYIWDVGGSVTIVPATK